jgi:hypothetical protein
MDLIKNGNPKYDIKRRERMIWVQGPGKKGFDGYDGIIK